MSVVEHACLLLCPLLEAEADAGGVLKHGHLLPCPLLEAEADADGVRQGSAPKSQRVCICVHAQTGLHRANEELCNSMRDHGTIVIDL